MGERRGRWRALVRLAVLLGPAAVLVALVTPARPAGAHPLDEYVQSTYLTVSPTEIVVELDLTPGVLLAPQVLPQLDPNGDRQISDDEGRTYVDAVLRDVVLRVDDVPLEMAVTGIDLPRYLNVQAGYGTIRVLAAATPPAGRAASRQISYANDFAPPGAAYQVNAFVARGAAVTLGKQHRDAGQQRLTVDYSVDAAAVAGTAPGSGPEAVSPSDTATTSGARESGRRVLGYLYRPALSPWVLLVALALAVVLGGLHALTPGHGKTLVAAYLVGGRGTVRHAVILGAIVTFTHTVSVVALGVVALFASQFIVPNVLVPTLEVVSGLLVVVIGARLVARRWSVYRGRRTAEHVPAQQVPAHHHAHDDGHQHDHGRGRGHDHGHAHDHGGGHTHPHPVPEEGVKLGGLAAMGVSGGLIPCPEALGIMVIAVGLNRILLGLGLIVSFSLGLAAVLIGLGVLLVRSRSLVERLGALPGRWSSTLPLVSAVIVTILGAGIVVRGLVGGIPLPA